MAKTADEIGTYLAAQGYGTVGSTSGTGIFIGPMAIEPDKAIAVRVSGGPGAEYTNESNTPWNEPTRIQIMVRDAAGATGYDVAESVANNIASTLEVSQTKLPTATGSVYMWMRRAAPVIPLTFDERERPIFVLNMEADKEPST